MTPAVALKSKRRTQPQRRAAMRERLLEATVECLHELGFNGTTTIEVARRAGVSRGAQLHHYPTRQKLVVAAIEHVLQKRLGEFRRGFSVPQGKGDRTRRAVELLWSLTNGSTFYAWLELLVAARTDPELRTAMLSIAQRFEQGVLEAFHEAFPENRDNPALNFAPWFTLAALQGFALDRILDPREPRVEIGLQILTSMGRQAFTPKAGKR